MTETRADREQELQALWAKDCIQLVRIYQAVIGSPQGQIPIPGVPPGRMIEVILNKEFPLSTLPPERSTFTAS
jgi:hypothetical protein